MNIHKNEVQKRNYTVASSLERERECVWSKHCIGDRARGKHTAEESVTHLASAQNVSVHDISRPQTP